jgi:hypothetical protein
MSSAMSSDRPAESDRCASVHWSLPVQCFLLPSHVENWHEALHPTSGSRIRYRWPGHLTEEWRDLGPRAGQDPDAYRRRLTADIEDARKTLANARGVFERLCNELAEFEREQREASRGAA